MRIKVICFSSLRNFLDARFAVEIAENSTFKDLRYYLIGINANANDELIKSSFWIDDRYQELDTIIPTNAEVCILPGI